MRGRDAELIMLSNLCERWRVWVRDGGHDAATSRESSYDRLAFSLAFVLLCIAALVCACAIWMLL
jgi:hypothetical protein